MVLFDKDLAMYFPFSEGSGVAVFDRSKYQNNGVVDGAIFVRPYIDMSNDSNDEGDNPLVIIDDGGVAFWTLVVGAESDDTTIVKKSINSYKVILAAQTLHFYHDYGVNQDFTQYDYASFWFYGCNTADTMDIWFINEVWAARANGYRYFFTDDFTGWRRFIVPLERFGDVGVPTGWDQIRSVRFAGSNPQTCSYYTDRLILDIGNWRFGECLQFDAINDKVRIPFDTSLNPLTEITCAAWVNIDAVRDCGIISTDLAPAILILGFDGANVRFRVYVSGASAQANWTYPATWVGEWHYVVGTFKDDIIYLYIDGVLRDTQVLVGVMLTHTQDLGIGVDRNGRFFGGLISEPRIYRYALSQTEIRTLYKEKEVD